MSTIIAPAAVAAMQAAIGKASDYSGSLLSRVGKAALQGNPIQSLADIGKAARVEPLVLIDDALRDQPALEDALKVALSTFTGYYLQAASLIMNIHRVEVLKVLDTLNPERSGVKFGEAIWSKEAYADGLPSLEQYAPQLDARVVVSIEEATPDSTSKGKSISAVSDDTLKQLHEVTNLAVGKIVNVEFKEGNDSVKVPVMIRLVPTYVPAKVLTHIFTATAKNSSWKERWHLWRSGQISFIRDLMFSMDLISEHRKALVNDTSNVYMTLSQRRSVNSLKSLASGTPTMADASNIAVISKATAKMVGNELYGKLDQLATRKKIFDATYLILLIVVDEEWERVTIYHRGLDQATELSFKEIKSAERGKGPDINEILKAYQLGSTPTI